MSRRTSGKNALRARLLNDNIFIFLTPINMNFPRLVAPSLTHRLFDPMPLPRRNTSIRKINFSIGIKNSAGGESMRSGNNVRFSTFRREVRRLV